MPSEDSGAEKRALWEVRQRYHIPKGSATAITPPSPPREVPPSRPRPSGRPQKPTRKRQGKIFKKLTFVVVIFALVAGSIFGYKVLSASNKISTTNRSVLGQLKDLLFSSNQHLKGEETDRINVLLIAVGGEGHSGEELADTIMVASIRPSDKSVGLLSIPRDLYVQVPGEEYYSKLNAVHAYGEAKKKDGGPALLRQKIEEITGQRIDYFARVDFTAFKRIVDAVGGIDIKIDNSFFDYWHKISFPAGTEHMNGERALAYVRARYIEGPEGGDFRRAARQQQVLLSLREKVFSVQTAFDFSAINSIIDSLSDNIRTDLELWQMKRFYELVRTIDHSNVHSTVLTTGPKGVLVGATEVLGGLPASILRTRTGDFSEIKTIAATIFSQKPLESPVDEPLPETPPPPPLEDGTSPSVTPSPTPTPSTSPVTVEVRNGTNIAGLAQKTKDTLTNKNYTVTGIGNAKNRSTEKTTVYALNLTHADEAKKIAELLHAQADSGLPKDEAKSESSILVILGTDAAQ